MSKLNVGSDKSDLEAFGKRVEHLCSKLQEMRDAVDEVIFGQDQVIKLTLITLLSGGHALLIGVPGLAKTRLVETLGQVLGLEDRRVQFTPDLMPADIIGSEVLEEIVDDQRVAAGLGHLPAVLVDHEDPLARFEHCGKEPVGHALRAAKGPQIHDFHSRLMDG